MNELRRWMPDSEGADSWFCWLLFLFLLVLLAPGVAEADESLPPPMAWTDSATGYAIGGFDPVDYFVNGKATRPNSGLELYSGGVNWIFANEGNREAFRLHPRIYMPRFGGYDPVMLGKGRAVVGEPILFDIYKDHLYLFHNRSNLRRWRHDRERIHGRAFRNWHDVANDVGIDPSRPENPDDKSVAAKTTKPQIPQCEPARWTGKEAGKKTDGKKQSNAPELQPFFDPDPLPEPEPAPKPKASTSLAPPPEWEPLPIPKPEALSPSPFPPSMRP